MTACYDDALQADGLVVPGVGAFAACMAGLRAGRAARELIARRLAGGRPVLGICVGMQVLFDSRRRARRGHRGLRRVAGHGRAARRADVLPHMGWNTVTPPEGSRLFAGLSRASGSTSCTPTPYAGGSCRRRSRRPPPMVTWAEHGEPFVAAVENGPLSATQFHPEKSGDAGAAAARATGCGRCEPGTRAAPARSGSERRPRACCPRARGARAARRRDRRRRAARPTCRGVPATARQQGLLARRRRAPERPDRAALSWPSQSIVWLIWPDPWVRAAAASSVLAALPVLVTLTLDRRSRP